MKTQRKNNNKNKKTRRNRNKYKKKLFYRKKGGMYRGHSANDLPPPPSYDESRYYHVLPVMPKTTPPMSTMMKPKLKPIVSIYWKILVCDESVNVVNNGDLMFEDLKLFLNSSPEFYPEYIGPEDYEKFSKEEKDKFIQFYGSEENKKWLGCQIYLYTTIKNITSDYAKFDDGNYFFRWLTHRLKPDEHRMFTEDAPYF